MKAFYTILLLSLHFVGNAQINGTVTDMEGEPLPFANVYLFGTTRGTTTNVEGEYFLELEPGNYQLVFRYVGYEQQIQEVELGTKPLRLDVKMAAESVNLQEVVVRADAEDPAYAVIRKAMAKRKYYRDLVDSYQCDVYIKGTQKLLDAPEKIFGQEIGNMGGTLDSNRQGIIYLSESEAKLYFQRPDQKREVMVSSKVSGNDNGFSFNRATLMDFSFYDNTIDIERSLVSPIGKNAFNYYDYRLLGTFYDKNGNLINKIEVLPKRSQDPVFRGNIYIVEDLWNIHSTELVVTGAAIKQPVLETLVIKQIHVPVKSPDVWMQLSQSLEFKFSIFGFVGSGNFTGVFSNYELDVEFSDRFFNNELFKVEEDANDKNVSYWDSIRPVPLTIEESEDYVKKDSLQEIWESKAYMDSIDAKRNRFKAWDLLFGYQYNKSYEKTYFSIGSPLTTIQFNAVQGFYGNMELNFRKFFDEYNTRWLRIKPTLQYGLSDERFRAEAEVTYNFNGTNFSRITLEGGRGTRQINNTNPITPTVNTLYSLIDKKNYLRLYEKDFLRLTYRRELVNGLYFRGSVEYANRRFLENTTNYSMWKRDDDYALNTPPFLSVGQDVPEQPRVIAYNEALLLRFAMRIRFGQKYITYPDRKFIMGSRTPDIWLLYTKGVNGLESEVDFDLLRVQVTDDLELGVFGSTEYLLEGGTFLNDAKMSILDLKHFRGNQTFLGDPSNYLSTFHLLDYFAYSTNENFVHAHFQHHFNGFLLDKIPGIRKLGLKTVLGASWLYVDGLPHYNELSFGLDNLGFGVVRFFRLDAVVSFVDGKYSDFGLMLGIDL